MTKATKETYETPLEYLSKTEEERREYILEQFAEELALLESRE